MAIKRKSKKPSIEDRITDISDSEEGIAALFYGRASTGKTAIMGTFPKPLLVLDIKEKGTATLRQTPGVQQIKIDEWPEIEEVYWYLHSGKGRGKFKTVGLDQVSQLQDLGLQKIRQEANLGPKDMMSQKGWGNLSGLMKTWLLNYRDLIDLGMNVVFNAHDRYTEGDEDAEDNQIDPSMGPRLMPSVSGFLNGAVSIIGNTFIRERFIDGERKKGKIQRIRKVEYCMRVGPHSSYATKLRTPRGSSIEVPDIMVNPTYEKLIAIVKGEETPIRKLKRK